MITVFPLPMASPRTPPFNGLLVVAFALKHHPTPGRICSERSSSAKRTSPRSMAIILARALDCRVYKGSVKPETVVSSYASELGTLNSLVPGSPIDDSSAKQYSTVARLDFSPPRRATALYAATEGFIDMMSSPCSLSTVTQKGDGRFNRF